MSFWNTGFGKILRTGANIATGGASELIVDAVTGGDKKGSPSGTKSGSGQNGGVYPSQRQSGPQGAAIKAGPALSTLAEKQAQKAARARMSTLDKAKMWVMENKVVTGVIAVVGFIALRAWQMTKPKSKRWAMFK